MTTGARYKRQRGNRVQLKADAATLLERITAESGQWLETATLHEIAAVLIRLRA